MIERYLLSWKAQGCILLPQNAPPQFIKEVRTPAKTTTSSTSTSLYKPSYIILGYALFAMKSNTRSSVTTAIIAALALLPIIIIIAIAVIAVRFTDSWPSICQIFSASFCRFRHKLLHKTDPSPVTISTSFADSWQDLESQRGGDCQTTPTKELPTKGWHPSRSNRLRWSFSEAMSSLPSHCESANIQSPFPAMTTPGITPMVVYPLTRNQAHAHHDIIPSVR